MADNPTIRVPDKLFFAQVRAMLAAGRSVQLRVQGDSMRPLLRPGRDTVVLTDYHAGMPPLRRGDIVLFCFGGQYILHRIVGAAGNRYLLAGDGNGGRREYCTREDIAALVTHVVLPSGRSIACSSRRWRISSRCWVALPHLVQRILLRFVRRGKR